ncbi:hypothetical protein ACXYTJ_08120 [Gilvimarinus sp. F26214L]|uniref:hypothetical protein n=1 Tax=Gilvimarinus sp. DZF01 TaxID=3461371 RepID=UPI0040460964
MVDERDIEIFLKAKRDQRTIDVLMGLSFVALATLVGLEALGVPHDYTVALATLSVVFMGASVSKSRWVSVPRNELVSSLERIINSDPEALTMVAEKRRLRTPVPDPHNDRARQ